MDTTSSTLQPKQQSGEEALRPLLGVCVGFMLVVSLLNMPSIMVVITLLNCVD